MPVFINLQHLKEVQSTNLKYMLVRTVDFKRCFSEGEIVEDIKLLLEKNPETSQPSLKENESFAIIRFTELDDIMIIYTWSVTTKQWNLIKDL